MTGIFSRLRHRPQGVDSCSAAERERRGPLQTFIHRYNAAIVSGGQPKGYSEKVRRGHRAEVRGDTSQWMCGDQAADTQWRTVQHKERQLFSQSGRHLLMC